MRRLVSAYYKGSYPFMNMGLFKSGISTDTPDDLKDGDALVVWGGVDIWPGYYNKGRSSFSWADDKPTKRDEVEWGLIQQAIKLGLPMIGVCRGAQMMCAAAGGFLYQDVKAHGGTHSVTTHDGKDFVVNSIHHQMMEPKGTKHELVAWTTPRSAHYMDVIDGEDVKHPEGYLEKEPEYIYFNDINAHAIQWHPEGLAETSQANQYLKEMLEETL